MYVFVYSGRFLVHIPLPTLGSRIGLPSRFPSKKIPCNRLGTEKCSFCRIPCVSKDPFRTEQNGVLRKNFCSKSSECFYLSLIGLERVSKSFHSLNDWELNFMCFSLLQNGSEQNYEVRSVFIFYKMVQSGNSEHFLFLQNSSEQNYKVPSVFVFFLFYKMV